MLTPTNAQAVSRVLRANGWRPHSAGDSSTRWPALQCKRVGDSVVVRVWANIEDEEPTRQDRDDAAAIAQLLADKGYKIDYTSGDYRLHVKGKIKMTKQQPDQERLGRLPKWAVREITSLRAANADLVRRLTEGPEDSNAFADPYMHPRPLGKNPTIQFGPQGSLEGFNLRYDGQALIIHGQAPNIDDYFAVFPTAGNGIEIRHTKKS